MTDAYHIPVLLREAIDYLAVKPGGTYVDCTFGGGGHSRAILEKLGPRGKLIAFDQDADAAANVPDDARLQFVPHNFRHLGRFLRLYGAAPVDGILADLGVSSHQFDESSRGFSTRFDGALDMRMDQRQELTAATVVNTYTEAALHKLFERYGEVTNARTLARTLVAARAAAPIQTIDGFKTAVYSVVKGAPPKYFAQVFQALRIEVNDEMDALRALLEQVPPMLKDGGRVAIITFHSGEDRLVKQFFKKGSFEEEAYNPFEMTEAANPISMLTKKGVEAGAEEVKRNPRARSARLRVAQKNSDTIN